MEYDDDLALTQHVFQFYWGKYNLLPFPRPLMESMCGE